MSAVLDVAATRRLQRVMDDQVEAGILPSCSAAIALDGEVVWAATSGPVATDVRYVIFSATKAIVAAAMWQLVDERAVRFDQPARDILPELGTRGSTPEWMARVTIADLLCHTAGFPTAFLPIDRWHAADLRREAYAEWSCSIDPGTTFTYHPVAAHWVVADVVEAVDGIPFTDAIHRRVTGPLGLRPALGGAEADVDDVRGPVVVGQPPTDDEWRAVGLEPPEPEPPERAQPFDIVELLSTPPARAVGVPGGGGVMTPAELALFYQALLHDPRGLWSADVRRAGTETVVDGLVEPFGGFPANRTMGLIVAGDDGFAGFRGFGRRVSRPRAFGHDGAGGQLAFADPDSGLSFAFTTDGMDLHGIRQWRRGRDLADVALTALPA